MLYQDYRINSSYQQLSIVVSNTKNMQLWKKEPKNQLLFSDYIIDKILLQHWIMAMAKKETILITERFVHLVALCHLILQESQLYLNNRDASYYGGGGAGCSAYPPESKLTLMVPATADTGINPYYVHNINTQLSAPTSIKYESRTSQKYCISEAKDLFMLL